MKYQIQVVLPFLSLFLAVINLNAQEKVEEEYRVKESEVPVQAQKWIHGTFGEMKGIKWYYEKSSGKASYEAKLKSDRKVYSIEFDTMGVIEDVEQKYEWNELESDIKTNLTKYFRSNYIKYKIIKIQKQYVGTATDLKNYIRQNEKEGITVNYEIEFHGKTQTENELWECLFSSNGELLQKKKIILKPANNLEF